MILILILFFSLLLCDCSLFEDDASKKVREFIDAFNALDLDRLAGCIDPRYEAVYKGVKGIVESFQIGVGAATAVKPFSKVNEMIPSLLNLGKNIIRSQCAQSGNMNREPVVTDMKFHVLKILSSEKRSSEERIVKAEMKQVLQGFRPGSTIEETFTQQGKLTFTLHKFGEEWRIINLQGEGQ